MLLRLEPRDVSTAKLPVDTVMFEKTQDDKDSVGQNPVEFEGKDVK